MLAGYVLLSDGSFLNLACLPVVKRLGADGVEAIFPDGSSRTYGGFDAREILLTIDPLIFGPADERAYAAFLRHGGKLAFCDWESRLEQLRLAVAEMDRLGGDAQRKEWLRAADRAAFLKWELRL